MKYLYFGLWLSGGSSSPFLFSTNFLRVAICGRRITRTIAESPACVSFFFFFLGVVVVVVGIGFVHHITSRGLYFERREMYYTEAMRLFSVSAVE